MNQLVRWRMVFLLGLSAGIQRQLDAQAARISTSATTLNLPVQRLPAGSVLSEQRMVHLTIECDDTLPGRRVARLTWANSDEAAAERRLDVTPYPNGFQKGLFATVYPLKTASSQPRPLLRRAANARTDHALSMTVGKPRQLPGTDSMAVTVSGMSPGLVYEWRLLELMGDSWQPTAIARAKVPVCAADRSTKGGHL
jgi:hypothetical protein